MEGALNKSNAFITGEALSVLRDAVLSLKNRRTFWCPVFMSDMSRVLGNAISSVFYGRSYAVLMKDTVRVCMEEAAEAYAARRAFRDVKLELDALAGVPDAAVAPDVRAPMRTLADTPPIADPDVLEYVPDRASGQMRMRLTESARHAITAASAAALVKLQNARESISDDVITSRDTILALDRPTIDRFRELGIVTNLHCQSHKAKAVVRTTKYAKNFKKLGPSRGWATRVAYAVIVAPFGKHDLYDPNIPSPFVGPKDALAYAPFDEIVGEMLRHAYVPCDESKWPRKWLEEPRVLRLRPLVADVSALPKKGAHATATQTRATLKHLNEAVYVFEIFAGTVCVVRAAVKRRRIVTGVSLIKAMESERDTRSPAAGTGDVQPSPTKTSTVPVDRSAAPEESEEKIEELKEDVDDDFAVAIKTVDKEAISASMDELKKVDELCADLLEDDADVDRDVWSALDPTDEAEEGEVVTTLLNEPLTPDVHRDCDYFENRFYFETERKIRGNLVRCLPLASLHHFHRKLSIVTGPCMRGLFPAAVNTSSHVESKFSLMRRQQSPNLPLETYLRTKCMRGTALGTRTDPSLMDAEVQNFRTTNDDAVREKETRATAEITTAGGAAAGETWKGGVSDITCKGIYEHGKKKGSKCRVKKLCSFGFCKRHCAKKQECDVHFTVEVEASPLSKAAFELDDDAAVVNDLSRTLEDDMS
jgi:hypothetical protein